MEDFRKILPALDVKDALERLRCKKTCYVMKLKLLPFFFIF